MKKLILGAMSLLTFSAFAGSQYVSGGVYIGQLKNNGQCYVFIDNTVVSAGVLTDNKGWAGYDVFAGYASFNLVSKNVLEVKGAAADGYVSEMYLKLTLTLDSKDQMTSSKIKFGRFFGKEFECKGMKLSRNSYVPTEGSLERF